MTRIEDMLRQTLVETPTAATTADPLAQLDGRVRRARRRLAFTAAAGVAVVAAAVVVPLATIGSGHETSVQIGEPPSPSPSATSSSPAGSQPYVWLRGGAHGVVVDDVSGRALVVTDHGNGATRLLVELRPDGSELHRWTLPGSALFVAEREGAVWVWGGGDGGYPVSEVTALHLGSDASDTLSLGRGQAVQSLAITDGGDAWAVTTDHVLHLTTSGGKAAVVEDTPLAGARKIVADSDGNLWVQADAGLIRLVPNGGPDGVYVDGPYTFPWADGFLLAAGAETDTPHLWVQTGPRQVGLLEPLTGDDRGGAPGDVVRRVDLPASATAVAEDGIGGLFVAARGGRVVFYNFAAVQDGGPPTDELPRDAVQVETMAVTPDGILLMQDFGGSVLSWKPRSA